MFLNLRQGAQVYMLHKTQTPYIEVGTVESINNMMLTYYPNMPSFPVDITVRVSDKTVTYQRLPGNVEIADVKDQSGEQVSVACSREAVNSEITSMRQKSLDVINSEEFHKKRIVVLDALMQQLNPEQAEKAAQQAEINMLKSQMTDMTYNISELMQKNKELVELLSRRENGTSSDDN